MNRKICYLAGSFAMSTAAHANAEQDSVESRPSGGFYTAYARVIEVDPIVTRQLTTEPENRCAWVDENRPEYYRDTRGHWKDRRVQPFSCSDIATG